MITLTVTVRETIGGPHVRARIWDEYPDGCRSLLAEDDYYPAVPLERTDEDPVVLACVALRQWAVRTIGSHPNV